jgi:hypothetical protein
MPTETKAASPKQNKSAFVRNLPPKLPAKEVVARAKKAGITLSEKYVYVIRSNSHKKRRGAGRGPGRPVGRPRMALSSGGPGTGAEREFRRLAIEIGVRRAEEILGETRKKVALIIAGS